MKLNSQTALKAGLFVALAANMNWGLQSIQSTELSSESVPANTAPAAAAPPTAVAAAPPASANAATVTAPPAEPAKVATVAPAEKPSAAEKAKLPEDTEDKKICGDTYQVRFKEVQRDGESYTEITFKQKGTADWSDPTIKSGQLHEVVKKKVSVDRVVESLVKAERSEQKLACDTADKVQTDATSAENAAKEAREAKEAAKKEAAEEKAREQKRIADGVKNCTMDKSGERIRKDEKLRCWLDRLADADQLDKKKPTKQSRRGRDDFDDDDMDSKQVLAKMKEIVRGPLRKQIKEMTLSTDESRQNEGIEAVDEAIETIKELASEHGLGTNRRGGYNSDVSKLIGELSALKTGAQTAQKSREMEDDVRSVRDQMRSSWAEYKRDPTNMMAAQEWQNSRMMHTQLANQLNTEIGNQFIAPLQGYRRAGLLTAEDYREFTSPFTNMRNMMIAALNPESQQLANLDGKPFTGAITSSAMGSDIIIPSDLAARRGQGSSGYARSAGITIPTTAPQLNLSRGVFNGASVPGGSNTSIPAGRNARGF